MSMSNYLENKILDHTLKGTVYTPPTTIYLGLFTSDPTDAGTGTEVSGGAYTRKPITFSSAVNGTSVSSADVLYDVATANWGTITHIGIYDALTSGNMIYAGLLTTSTIINTGDQFKIALGDVSIALD